MDVQEEARLWGWKQVEESCDGPVWSKPSKDAPGTWVMVSCPFWAKTPGSNNVSSSASYPTPDFFLAATLEEWALPELLRHGWFQLEGDKAMWSPDGRASIVWIRDPDPGSLRSHFQVWLDGKKILDDIGSRVAYRHALTEWLKARNETIAALLLKRAERRGVSRLPNGGEPASQEWRHKTQNGFHLVVWFGSNERCWFSAGPDLNGIRHESESEALAAYLDLCDSARSPFSTPQQVLDVARQALYEAGIMPRDSILDEIADFVRDSNEQDERARTAFERVGIEDTGELIDSVEEAVEIIETLREQIRGAPDLDLDENVTAIQVRGEMVMRIRGLPGSEKVVCKPGRIFTYVRRTADRASLLETVTAFSEETTLQEMFSYRRSPDPEEVESSPGPCSWGEVVG